MCKAPVKSTNKPKNSFYRQDVTQPNIKAPKAKTWNNKCCNTLFSAKYNPLVKIKPRYYILLRNAGNTGSDFQPGIKNRSYHLCQILVETAMSVTRQSVCRRSFLDVMYWCTSTGSVCDNVLLHFRREWKTAY